MIAPHFERLSKEHSSPKKAAFAKINVDTQSGIARTHGVIFHGGQAVKTIKGANPPALTQAITEALKLGNAGKAGASFQTQGRTLGGDAPRASLERPAWQLNDILKNLFMFLGLYLVSLLSVYILEWTGLVVRDTNKKAV
jgi:thioredoxin 1